MKGKNKEFIGIDLSGPNLKISSIKIISNKPEVTVLLHQPIAGLADAEISKIVASHIAQLKLKTANLIDVIPPQLTITKNIEVPSVNPKEIKEIIGLQAGRHTPYGREEIIVDYVDIGTYKRNYTKILLVIISRNVIKRHFELLHNAGIRCEDAVYAAEGVARFVSKALKLESELLPAALIHMDEQMTDFSIIVKSKVIFVRSIPIGSGHISLEKAKYEDKLIEEIKKSFESYQNENIEQPPREILISGTIPLWDTGAALLTDTFHLPIRYLDYLAQVNLSSAVRNAAAGTTISFLNVIAPAVCRESLKADLVPEEIKLKRALEKRGRELFKTGILVLTITVLSFAVLMSNMYFQSVYLGKLKNIYAGLHEEALRIEKSASKNSLIRKYLSSRGLSLEVLAALYGVAPDDLQFNDIKYDEQGRLSLKGTADSMAAVFMLVERLEKSPNFREVKTKYTTKRKESRFEVIDFEITCLVNSGGD